MTFLFTELVKHISVFGDEQPIRSEADLESRLLKYLKEKGYEIERQVSKKKDRYDLICKYENQTVCIELKMMAKINDIKQFDKYLAKFPNGFIIVCWQATFSVRDIYKSVKDQSPTPVALIELAKMYAI